MLRIALVLFLVTPLLRGEDLPSTNGMVAVFQQEKRTDALVLPNLALFVSSNSAPTVFLRNGPFTVEFKGFITVELRTAYTFQALTSGELELLINGAPILAAQGTEGLSPPGKPVRLNRGKNAVLVRFKSLSGRDARMQILWAAKNWPVAIPISTDVLSHDIDPVLLKQDQLRHGLNLLAEYRCVRCHGLSSGVRVELDFGAPDFDGIGSRLEGGWIADWIANPFRTYARMPRLFSEEEREKPGAISAFLSTLTTNAPLPRTEGSVAQGEELFKNLHCAACHAENDPALKAAPQKFKIGALAAYLENPQGHYRSSPMPNFKLSLNEAESLALYLASHVSPANDANTTGSAELGRTLIQNSGCLNCHSSNLENKYGAPDLARVASAGQKGCLSTNKDARAPQFNLRDDEKAALEAFLKAGDFSGLTNSVPHEFALRAVQRLQCAECHDKIEGLPRVSIVGAKLKPGWSARFIAAEIAYKARPWMTARMPGFPSHAEMLAHGLAALHGVPPWPATEPANEQLAAIGAQLVSAAGGFSCVACHAVGSFTRGQVVETPGVNLAYSGERLLHEYFQRWVINPVAIDPSTKMPVYFDSQGRSQLSEILEGDGAKQIEAIWEYVKLGSKMPPPATR